MSTPAGPAEERFASSPRVPGGPLPPVATGVTSEGCPTALLPFLAFSTSLQTRSIGGRCDIARFQDLDPGSVFPCHPPHSGRAPGRSRGGREPHALDYQRPDAGGVT